MVFLSSSYHGGTIPSAEFASLSLLGQDPSVCCVTVVSPLVTTPSEEAKQSVMELHDHLLELDSYIPLSLSNHHASSPNPPQESAPYTPQRQIGETFSLDSKSTPQIRNSDHLPNNSNNKESQTTQMVSSSYFEVQLMKQQHSHCQDSVSIFRPSSGGITLVYQLLRNVSFSTIQAIFGVTSHPKPLVLCVGIQGDTHSLSPQFHTRLLQCIQWLEMYKKPINKPIQELSRKLTMALTSVLMDDETIQVYDTPNDHGGMDLNHDSARSSRMMNSSDKSFRKTNFKPSSSNVARVLFMKKKKKSSKEFLEETNNPSSSCFKSISSVGLPSSDVARIISEQLQVLSLAETDMVHLRKYNNNHNNKLGRKKGGYSRSPSRASRKSLNQFSMRTSMSEGSDLPGFDYHPPHYYQQQSQQSQQSYDVTNSSSNASMSSKTNTTSSMSDSVSISADTINSFSTRSFGNNSLSLSSVASIPTLVGSRKDSDVSKKDFRKNRILAASQRKLGGNNHHNNNQALVVSDKQSSNYGYSNIHTTTTTTSLTNSHHTNDRLSNVTFDPFSFQDDIMPSSPTLHKSSNGHHRPRLNLQTTFSNDDEDGHPLTTTNTGNNELFRNNMWPSTNEPASADKKMTQLFVNIALNEDLTCSYRNSKISSCSIEGMMQAQLQSNSSHLLPFSLSIHDPSKHIKSIQGNTNYAKDSHSKTADNEKKKPPDHKYIVTIPRIEEYFPILKYKCSNELRPVPIRVQTRVRHHDKLCRVALQISSNPANEDKLTNLTIIMAVPQIMKGETLFTSPAGGSWNEGNRSVVWCVAEVGIGQKFQLQAQFEMETSIDDTSEENIPSFPVLVRCQCMSTQLSNIQIDVSQHVPDTYPSKVMMKLEKRFRVSHRER